MNDNKPRPRWEHAPVKVCIDCYMLTATGETPHARPLLATEIQTGAFPSTEGWQLECGDPENSVDHSYVPCETCGHDTFGPRYELIAMRRIAPA